MIQQFPILKPNDEIVNMVKTGQLNLHIHQQNVMISSMLTAVYISPKIQKIEGKGIL